MGHMTLNPIHLLNCESGDGKQIIFRWSAVAQLVERYIGDRMVASRDSLLVECLCVGSLSKTFYLLHSTGLPQEDRKLSQHD